MDAEDIAQPEANKCLIVNGKKLCYDPMPSEEKKDKCVNIAGYYFCENGEKEMSLKEESAKFLKILLNPVMETDEASYMEMKWVEYTVGFFLGALAFTLSFYIKDVIDLIVYSLLPGSMTLLTLFLVIAIMTACAIILVFIEYRLRKAVASTKVIEKAVKKTLPDLIDDIATPD